MDEERYYEPVKVKGAINDNYIEYVSNGENYKIENLLNIYSKFDYIRKIW